MAWYLSVLTLPPPPYHLVRHTTVFVYRSRSPRRCLASIPHPNPFACLPNLSYPPPPPSKLSLDALSRTAYMATRSSPPRDFDSCLIHVAPSFPPVLVLNFLARLSSTILFAVYSSKLASPSAKQIHDRITTSNNNIFRLTESKKVEGAARDTHGRVKMGACRGHGTYERVRARWVSNM